MVTVRVFLAIAVAKQWELYQMDVHNAFLHGDFEEEVFMKLPPGLHKGQPGEACKLRKSLYELRQAPRCWFLKLSSALKKIWLCSIMLGLFSFYSQQNGVQLNVLVYVDDLIVFGNDHEAITQFKTYLNLAYSVHILSQFMQNPQIEHWEAAIRVVRYLKGSPGQDVLNVDGNLTCKHTLAGPSDLNYPALSAVFPEDKKVTTVTIHRTVTNVGPPTSKYHVVISQFNGVDVKVEPSVLSFTKKNQKLSYKVTFTTKSRQTAPQAGALIWKDGVHKVRSPVIITWLTPL
uniref:Subtilisin-like protease SBT1.3 n=1 Tax=Tanacetum cinerariifolium TaxID=118510 RepID=A0A6L2LY94_TANCI|nr:subtilisin-like protease SBT1.3 [Tanacetum cinerariifolium]